MGLEVCINNQSIPVTPLSHFTTQSVVCSTPFQPRELVETESGTMVVLRLAKTKKYCQIVDSCATTHQAWQRVRSIVYSPGLLKGGVECNPPQLFSKATIPRLEVWLKTIQGSSSALVSKRNRMLPTTLTIVLCSLPVTFGLFGILLFRAVSC
jgi:hypothetical protein